MGMKQCSILFSFLFPLTPRICDALPLSRERGEKRPQCGRWGECICKYDNKLFFELSSDFSLLGSPFFSAFAFFCANNSF